jgi:hypothetical protein
MKTRSPRFPFCTTGDQQQAQKIGLDLEADTRGVALVEQSGLRETRVVHDDVRDSQGGLTRLEEGLHRVLLADVQGAGVDLDSELPGALCHVEQAILAARAECQLPALLRAGHRDGFSEARGSAGNQRGAARACVRHAEKASPRPGRGHS